MYFSEEYFLANRCSIDRDRAAFEELKRRHLAGNDIASIYYANFLSCDMFVPKDRFTAIQIIDRLVAKGVPLAYYFKSIFDKEHELYWVKKGVEKGDPDCLCSMGYFYDMGEGVPESKQKAVECYIKAYNIGSGRAAGWLVSYFYDHKDYKTALQCSEVSLKVRTRGALEQAYVLAHSFDRISAFDDLYRKYKYSYPKSCWKD